MKNLNTTICVAVLLGCCCSLLQPLAQAQPRLTKSQAEQTLKSAVRFFREEVSASGGYLWRYSSDLKYQEGEGRADSQTAWVQPPGTPSVGDVYLDAFDRTGDRFYLEAATETGMALVRGQLQSGGWDYRIEFDPERRQRYAYRADGIVDATQVGRRRNVTTLDDNTTQRALQFLMRLDRTLEFQDQAIHESASYALDKLLAAQYPIGAWPQRFDRAHDPADFPVLKANYPSTWSREYPSQDYRHYYTFNDNTLADMIVTMFDAADVYRDDRYREAAVRAGEFILLAQMPEPQPAWAQQYNPQMQPAWARKFEPPSVTGGESQGVIKTLVMLYRRTGQQKFLQPVPRAIAYLKESRLPDGRIPRFLELKTNKPLYFTKDYRLTYDNSDMPTHYGFITSWSLGSIERELPQLRSGSPSQPGPAASRRYRRSASLTKQAQAVVDAIDQRGAWVEPGTLRTQDSSVGIDRVIESRTFLQNVDLLTRFIAAE